jgi:S1-C subfamily serine protease
VNALDAAIVLAAALAVVGGFRRGFVARITSWVGMGLGLYLGARLLPAVATALDGATEITLLSACAAVLIGCTFLGQAVGLAAGARLRVSVGEGKAHRTDQTFGALTGLLAVTVAVWLLLPALATVREWPAEQARTSVLADAIHDHLPTPPDALQGLGNLVGSDRFPEVLAGLQQAPEVGPVPAASGLSAETAEQARQSTVKVLGEACGRLQEGSGFVAGPDRVVTNAHVVAGTEALAVERSDGSQVAARVVAFDPSTDLAVLSVPGIDRPALRLGEPAEGDVGGGFGHPGGGELEISPFEVARLATAEGTDIYDERPSERDVLFLAAEFAAGDSGSALVRSDGTVVGVVFAIAPDREGVGYALNTSEVRPMLDTAGSTPVSTGPCI